MKNKYLILIIIVLIPISILIKKEQKKEVNTYTNEKIYIKLNNEKLYIEDYLVGVLAAEMPASFEIEALKAQAVAARTYAYYKYINNQLLTGTTSDQAFINDSQMQSKWGEDYKIYKEKISKAIEDTKDLIITYQENPIIAFYFSMSNGTTENSLTVFGEELPYIQSVKSPWEENHQNYQETITYKKEEICKMLNIDCTSFIVNKITYNENNRIDLITINDIDYTGVDFRNLLNLRSTDITININDNQVTLITNGYGHGVGMSQYGANGLAKEGKTYEEILKYYYQDIEINKITV